MVLGREAANIRELMMFGQKDNSAREIYTSFYTPKTGADGVWELPLVLETVAEASETTIPLPLPYRKLNAEVLEYLEDVAQQMPKGEEARIVVYLPIEEIQQGLEQKLNKVLDIYGDARLEKLKREEKRALGASLSALAWGFAFMLVCQIIGVLADFPKYPTLTNTISEGFLVLGWVALWKPFETLLFDWRPSVERTKLHECLAAMPVVLRPLPATLKSRLTLDGF